MKRILITESDRDFSALLQKFLSRKKFDVMSLACRNRSVEMVLEEKPELVICDIDCHPSESVVFIKEMKEKAPFIPVIAISGTHDIKTAVEIIKAGAQDCLIKPFLPDQMLKVIQAAEKAPNSIPSTKNEPVFHPMETTGNSMIFGQAPLMRQLKEQADLVAGTCYSVIIEGESGSGKEALARYIHEHSPRKQQPFIALDCGTLSKELSASELFGHIKGSFTGAATDKKGMIELANGGTLFLDEIGNLPYEVQVSLLRTIQERKIRPVGGSTDTEVDIRIIVATNEKLSALSRNGSFRADLFHRLNEFSLYFPPLRERKEDIEIFARHFLKEAASELEKQIPGFTASALLALKNHEWPGNLRELKNAVRRMALQTENGTPIEVVSLPPNLSSAKEQTFPAFVQEKTVSSAQNSGKLKRVSVKAELELILKTLEKVHFNKSKAAQMMNISRRTLYNKLKLI